MAKAGVWQAGYPSIQPTIHVGIQKFVLKKWVVTCIFNKYTPRPIQYLSFDDFLWMCLCVEFWLFLSQPSKYNAFLSPTPYTPPPKKKSQIGCDYPHMSKESVSPECIISKLNMKTSYLTYFIYYIYIMYILYILYI